MNDFSTFGMQVIMRWAIEATARPVVMGQAMIVSAGWYLRIATMMPDGNDIAPYKYCFERFGIGDKGLTMAVQHAQVVVHEYIDNLVKNILNN